MTSNGQRGGSISDTNIRALMTRLVLGIAAVCNIGRSGTSDVNVSSVVIGRKRLIESGSGRAVKVFFMVFLWNQSKLKYAELGELCNMSGAPSCHTF